MHGRRGFYFRVYINILEQSHWPAFSSGSGSENSTGQLCDIYYCICVNFTQPAKSIIIHLKSASGHPINVTKC